LALGGRNAAIINSIILLDLQKADFLTQLVVGVILNRVVVGTVTLNLFNETKGGLLKFQCAHCFFRAQGFFSAQLDLILNHLSG